jgi:hypothetical protein
MLFRAEKVLHALNASHMQHNSCSLISMVATRGGCACSEFEISIWFLSTYDLRLTLADLVTNDHLQDM